MEEESLELIQAARRELRLASGLPLTPEEQAEEDCKQERDERRRSSVGLRLRLNMAPHPEGGWFTETFRAPSQPGVRPAVSAIYFLLQQGERSHWHTVDACELWLWHAGSPLHLHVSADAQRIETLLLGADVDSGQRPQATVPAGVWQSAESAGSWTLVSCIVAPAFDYSGFTLAAPGWFPH